MALEIRHSQENKGSWLNQPKNFGLNGRRLKSGRLGLRLKAA
jgi:hypothetical protein